MLILINNEREKFIILKVKRLTRKSTIKDIAKLCGVSVSTVSYALNGNPKISDERRDQIKEAARKLNYVPHDSALRLVNGTSNIIGLNISQMNNPYLVSVSEKIVHIAREKGYSILLSIWDDAESRKKDLDTLVGKNVAGIISGPLFCGHDPLLSDVYNVRGIPTVVLGRANGLGIPQVGVDYRKGAFLATEHLIKSGHETIGYMCLPDDDDARRDGFKDALLKYTVRYCPEWSVSGFGTLADGYAKMRTLLESGKALPTAFVCHNDLCATGVLRAMAEKGLRTPKDISLVGFDNIEAGKYLTPSLTTLDPKEDEHAVRVFEMLEAQIKSTGADCKTQSSRGGGVSYPPNLNSQGGLESPPSVNFALAQDNYEIASMEIENRNVLIAPELVIRESCAAPKMSN
jgi:LacI family transcriptional regulator